MNPSQIQNDVLNELLATWRAQAEVEVLDINGEPIEPAAGDETPAEEAAAEEKPAEKAE